MAHHISRIDSSGNHCWVVRLRDRKSNGVNKSFSDSMNGGKLKALNYAIKFRDKELNKINKYCKSKTKLRGFPKFYSKGYSLVVRKRDYGVYKAYNAQVFDMFISKYHRKYFGYENCGGQREARKQVELWVKKTRNKIEKFALSVGLTRK
ncbi:MAG: hypothetical protein ACC657_05520 [Thiohalomonadales bacterium]